MAPRIPRDSDCASLPLSDPALRRLAAAGRRCPRGVLSGGGEDPSPGLSDYPSANPTDTSSNSITSPPYPSGTPGATHTGSDGAVTYTGPDGSVTVSGPSGSVTFTGHDGSVTVTGPGGSTVVGPSSPTALPGGNNGGNGGSGGNPTDPITGSPSGTVLGPSDRHVGLSPAAITAILLAILLVLAIIAVGGRLLWRRHQERKASYHVETLPSGGRPGQRYSNTSFTFDPQMAERLRGGVIEPYNGTASAESLSSQYRIEPFAVPPRPAHARTHSTTRLLDDAAAFSSSPAALSPLTSAAPLKGPRPLPRGAMNLQLHGHTFSGLTPLATPMGTPMTDDLPWEIPPTYASLQPRPVRRWYQFWPPAAGNSNHNNSRSNSNVASQGHASGHRSGSLGSL
ncbi:hypothetical protein BKA62DRAFT_348976 [Auriculariales sp. MPI-PUGE-AT-0066]|nr:hypothetical protein BKA62DRAFT_348976 [Auriculariales sp. MPI-PUGE-AT-0066]